MLNRRHLRIKVLQILYAFYQSDDQDALRSAKELHRSVEKIYDLYLYYLLTFDAILANANRLMEDKRNKLRPTEEDLNPNRNFVDNPVFNHFVDNKELEEKSKKHGVNWQGAERQDLMKKLWEHIKSSIVYQEYMEERDTNFERDQEFVVELFKTDIANFELLHDFFENESIYWMDDIDLVCTMVIKSLRKVEDKKSGSTILPLYKNREEEVEFIDKLLYKTIERDEQNDKLIDELARNWDLERIAKMDIILLKMALTELIEHTSIPKKVTLNEYIEISKFYSTPKSQVFINGILDKAVIKLEKDGLLVKSGRGLID